MAKVIPAILEKNLEDIRKKVALVKPYVSLVHLDIMDGQFVPNTTWNNPQELTKTPLGIKFNPHLMIKNPEFYIKKWSLPEVETVIFHRESANNISEAINLIKKTGKKVGVAINPQTSSYDIKDYLKNIDLVLVMGVVPGFAAQAFNADVLVKIKYLKELKPDLIIEVDGGVNDLTKNKIIKAGADILSANSYLFKSKDIALAIKSLEQ